MSRREQNAKRVRALRDEGLGWRGIVAETGLGRSYVFELLKDPEGLEVRARKDSYRGACETCGAPTDGSNGAGNAPTICLRCNGNVGASRSREEWREHREKVERLWAEGMLSWKIAAEMGWHDRALVGSYSAATFIARCRLRGYDLPHRRPDLVRNGKCFQKVPA